MPCYFMPMHPHEHTMHYSRYRRGSSPCGSMVNPFALFFLFCSAPTLMRLAFCLLTPLVNMAFFVAALYMIKTLFNEISCDDFAARERAIPQSCFPSSESSSDDAEHACKLRSCFAKMRAAARSAEQSASVDSPLRRRDLSSVSVAESTDGVRVLVAAPGLKPEDLSVSVVDDKILVKGESKKADGEVYVVDRTIVPSRRVDLDSVSCSHADGVLTLSLARKAAKHIPVTKGVAVAEEQEVPVVDAAAPVAADPDSEGEWIDPAGAAKDVE